MLWNLTKENFEENLYGFHGLGLGKINIAKVIDLSETSINTPEFA